MEKLTAKTITNQDIRALYRRAVAAGDAQMADTASRAIDQCEEVADPREVRALRQVCANAINRARTLAD